MSKLVDEFVQRYTFDVKNKTVSVRNLDRNPTPPVDLKLGQLYRCEIAKTVYLALLTNVEFKNKLFFSVTVDLYAKEGGALFKPDVYFYNPPVIFDRASRFPLHKDTISNNVAFWSSLQTADESDLPAHHSEVQFLRMALENTASLNSKDCRRNIHETRKKNQEVLTQLDAAKNKKPLPSIRMENTNNETVTIYGMQKNKGMKQLLKLKRGDQVQTQFNTNYGVQELVVTVVDITSSSVVIEWAVKEGGLKRSHEIALNHYEDPFWQNLVKLEQRKKTPQTTNLTKSRKTPSKKADPATTTPEKKDTSVVDFLSRKEGGGRRRVTLRRRRLTPWPWTQP